MYYPIILKTAGRAVVVIGGGEVAEGKVQTLLEAAAHVTVVSPAVTPRLQALADSGQIVIVRREYQSKDIKDAFFVIAATADPIVQERVAHDARRARVLINTVDDPEHCDFIMPSVLRRDDLIVA